MIAPLFGAFLVFAQTATPFGATDFAPGLTEARAKNPTAISINPPTTSHK